MNILVTGGSGQLGQVFSHIQGEYPGHEFSFCDIDTLDICDLPAVTEMIRKTGTECIINCAAYTQIDKAEAEITAAEKVNYQGPRVLAQAAIQNDIKLFHLSTDYVFSGRAPLPLRESDPTGPATVYGRTKLEGERAILESGCRGAIIRTSWLYSEFGNNFVKTMLRLAGERDELSVVYDQAGTPTYAGDLARAILKIVDMDIAGCEIYHFSNEGVLSWYDFTKAIFELAGRGTRVKPIRSEEYPSAAHRPAYSVLDKGKIKKAGVEVPYWRDSLAVCLKNLSEI